MLKNSLFWLFLIACLGANGAVHAWPLITDTSIHAAWGVSNTDWAAYPTGVNYQQFCVGNTEGPSGCTKMPGTWSDDNALVGLVAWQINQNGGYFCVTQFQCEGKKNPYTWNMAPQGIQRCFWLCKNGYSGEGCMPIDESEYVLKAGDAACSKKDISRDTFSGNDATTDNSNVANQEYSIPLFYNGRSGGKEKDVMLGVSGWLPNKKGVVASPFLFWCSNAGNANDFDINFYPHYKSETLCLPGYTGENCERCKASRMCDGYSLSDYDATKHTLLMKGERKSFGLIKINKTCTFFNCNEGTGFASATQHSECVECKGGQAGVNEDGVCVKCPTGQIWDTNAKGCRQALVLSHPAMRYGAGKTAAPENISDACWAKEDPVQYDCCVRNKKWNANSSKCE